VRGDTHYPLITASIQPCCGARARPQEPIATQQSQPIPRINGKARTGWHHRPSSACCAHAVNTKTGIGWIFARPWPRCDGMLLRSVRRASREQTSEQTLIVVRDFTALDGSPIRLSPIRTSPYLTETLAVAGLSQNLCQAVRLQALIIRSDRLFYGQ
jgi:hypothetical protein